MVDRLVDEPPGGDGGWSVGHSPVVNKREGGVQGVHNVLNLAGGSLRPVSGLAPLGVDTHLLGGQDFFGDAAAVVELDQLLLLGVEVAQSAGVAVGLFGGDLGFDLDVSFEGLADGGLLGLGEREAPVDTLNRLLDMVDAVVTGAAAPAAGDTAQAAEVFIDPTFAAMAAVAQPSATGAVDRALEVVLVLGGAVAAGAVSVEDFLHPVKGRLVYQLLVATFELDAVASDDAQVVVVAEYAMDRGSVERLASSLGGVAAAQAGFL